MGANPYIKTLHDRDAFMLVKHLSTEQDKQKKAEDIFHLLKQSKYCAISPSSIPKNSTNIYNQFFEQKKVMVSRQFKNNDDASERDDNINTEVFTL